MDCHEFLTQFHDFLAPNLDRYEQAIYLYVIRHSRLVGEDAVTIGINSSARKGAFGRRRPGKAMSPGNCREKLRSLETKGCIKVLGCEHRGIRIQALLPSEIPGIIPPPADPATFNLEMMDFVEVAENRILIL